MGEAFPLGLVWAIISVLIMLGVLLVIGYSVSAASLVLQLFIGCAASIGVILYFSGRDVFHPLSWLAMYVVLYGVLGAVISVSWGYKYGNRSPYVYENVLDVVNLALLVLLSSGVVAFVGYAIGLSFARKSEGSVKNNRPCLFSETPLWNRRLAFLIAMACFVLGGVGVIQTGSALDVIEATSGARSDLVRSEGFQFGWLLTRFLVVGLYVLIVTALVSGMRLWQVISLLLIVVFVLFLATGARGAIGFGLIFSIVAYHYLRRRLSFMRLGVIVSLVFVLAIGVSALLLPSEKSKSANTVFDPVEGILTGKNRHFDRLENLGLLLSIHPEVDQTYLYGRPYLKVLSRTGLMDHEEVSSRRAFMSLVVPEMYQAGFGTSPGLVGDLYLNFGYFGIYGGMLIVGGLLAILDRVFKRRLVGNPAYVLVYGAIGSCLLPIFGGYPESTIPKTLTLVIPIALISWICSYKTPKSRNEWGSSLPPGGSPPEASRRTLAGA